MLAVTNALNLSERKGIMKLREGKATLSAAAGRAIWNGKESGG